MAAAIKEYSLIDYVTNGDGSQSNPYQTYDAYFYGNSNIKITTTGSGMLSFNMRNIYQTVFAEKTPYHVISVLLNGVLVEADITRLEQTGDFNVYVPVSGESELTIVFSGSDDALTYCDLLEVYLSGSLTQEDYNDNLGDFNTTTAEPTSRIPVATLDQEGCGLSTTRLTDNVNFEMEDGTIYFIGSLSVEAEYVVVAITGGFTQEQHITITA